MSTIGVIVNVGNAGNGLFGVVLLAVEARARGRILCPHIVCAWLAERVGYVTTAYLVGNNGETPVERLAGKPVHEEASEFGECLW